MLSILSPETRPVVAQIARQRTLLVFDFDGTLAPLVPDRTAAAMLPSTAALLRAAALLYPCAVVSGRSRADVAARVSEIPLVAVVGNHGAELGFGPVDARYLALARGWKDGLARRLEDLPGVEIEDKGLGIAVHHRAATAAGARERILEAARALPWARVIPGKAVVNVVPQAGQTKADALAWLCRRDRLEQAVYVGDDASDEDVFRGPANVIGVRVTPDAESGAPYSLPDQGSVNDLLRLLVSERARLDGLDVSGERLAEVVAPRRPPAP